VLGSNIVSLEPYAFANLGNLTNLVLDSALTSISGDAFSGAGLVNAFIPAGVTNIDAGLFLNCYHLTNFTVDVANPAYSTVDGVLFNTSKTSLIAFPNGRAGAYVIPDGVTNIAADAFQYCTRLTSITIPNGVRTIGDNAFYQCASLTSIDLPSGLLTLGNSAFTLSGLKSANIPSGVLGDDAFDGCYSLAHIMLGTNVTSIGSIAFDDCVVPSVFIPQSVTNIGTMPFADSALTNITVDPLNPAYRSVNGVLFDSGQTRLIQYPAARSGNYVIPDSVTNIGDGAFWSCIGLTNVTIPEGVQYLGPEAFDYCISLTNVSLPNGITNIPYAAFEDCFSLTNVSLGTNVIDIGFNAFSSCRSLEGVTLPDSVVQIEPGAFSTCRALKSITLGNQVSSIGYDAFADCDDLSKIIIQSSGLHIGSYAFEYGPTNRAFYFTGDAPSLDSSPFYQNVATVYYLAGSVGWGPTLDNLPTALWNP